MTSNHPDCVTLRVAAHVLPRWRAASTFKRQRSRINDGLGLRPRATTAAWPASHLWERLPVSATWQCVA